MYILHYIALYCDSNGEYLYNPMPGPSCLVLEAIAADRRRCVSRTDMATATGTRWDPSCEVRCEISQKKMRRQSDSVTLHTL